MHDANGNLLKDGDEVLLRGRIVSSTGGTGFCNVTVEATHKPEGEDVGSAPVVTGNSRFFELAEKPDSVHTDEQLAEAARTVEERRDNVRTDEELGRKKKEEAAE